MAEEDACKRPATFLTGIPSFDESCHLIRPRHKHWTAVEENYDCPGICRGDHADEILLDLWDLHAGSVMPAALEEI